MLEPALKEIEEEMQGGKDTLETRMGARQDGRYAVAEYRWLDQKMGDAYRLEMKSSYGNNILNARWECR